jgi:hypothetical protein
MGEMGCKFLNSLRSHLDNAGRARLVVQLLRNEPRTL